MPILSVLPRRRRRAGTYRPAIASAIQRRIATAEPLSIRAIIAEAGGGSTDTVREELERAGIEEGARLLEGDAIRSAAEREATLRDHLQRTLAECEVLRMSNAALKETVMSVAQPSKVIEHQVAEIGRDVRGAVEQILREATRLRQARVRSTETVTVSDPLAEARYQKLVQEHTNLIASHSRLRQLYFDATGEHFE